MLQKLQEKLFRTLWNSKCDVENSFFHYAPLSNLVLEGDCVDLTMIIIISILNVKSTRKIK